MLDKLNGKVIYWHILHLHRWRRDYSSSQSEREDYSSLEWVRSTIWPTQLREELWCSWWVKPWVIIRDCFWDGYNSFEMKNNSRSFSKLASLWRDSMSSLVFKHLALWSMTNKQRSKQRQFPSGYLMQHNTKGIC